MTAPPRLRLVTPPVALPVTLAEAKAYLRVDSADDVMAMLAAATDMLDGRAGTPCRFASPRRRRRSRGTCGPPAPLPAPH